MSYYEVLLFGHVLTAAIWFGAGVLLLVLGARFDRARNDEGLRSLFEQADWTAQRVFIPAAIAVLVLGILLVFEGPWSFGDLWIVLGLAGFAATFATGIGLLKPTAARIAATIERDGMSDGARLAIRRLFRLQWIDYAVIAVVFASMTLKPTSDDVGTLVVMAAVILVTVVLALRGGERGATAADAA